MKIIHACWTILYLMGNLFHLYWVSSKYFRYEVTTNVQVMVPETISSPSMNFCLPFWQLINWSNMSEPKKHFLLTRPIPDSEYDERELMFKNLDKKNGQLNMKRVINAIENASFNEILM